MKRMVMIVGVAWAAVAGLSWFSSQTLAQIGVDIHIGVAIPAPVVVVPVEIVGVRRPLYDADLRLRIAEADEWRASEALTAARVHEGEIADALADAQAVVVDLQHRVADVDVDGLKRRLDAVNHRIAGANEDLKAAHELHDQVAAVDAETRIAKNTEEAAALQDQIARAATADAIRAQLHDVEVRVARLSDDLAAAHDAVYDAEVRLAADHDYVCAALHDRDEALWVIYKDQLIIGLCDPAVCGFTLDLKVFGGRLPRDPEVLHAYFVHDAGYWRDHSDLIAVRIDAVSRIKEITAIRDVERVKEPVRIVEVEKVEKVVKVEDIRKVQESVKVERDRAASERTERETAVKEGRKPNVTKFVAEAHPPRGGAPAAGTPDTGGRHHDSSTPATPDTGGRHHDSGTSSTPTTPDTTGGRHHDSETPSTPDTSGRHHDNSTPSTPSTPDTSGRHHDSETPSTPTSQPSGGRHHSGD